MKTINCTLLEAFVSDNREYASEYETIAEYILTNCEATGDYAPFLEHDATEEEIEEFTNYVNETYYYPAYTYDIYFNDETASNNKGFSYSKQEAINYIKAWNGTNESYFADYKAGVVEVVCNETGETVYEEEVR